jgi:hypothetical protein
MAFLCAVQITTNKVVGFRTTQSSVQTRLEVEIHRLRPRPGPRLR